MKKWLCLLLSFVLLMSFAACDSDSGGGGGSSGASSYKTPIEGYVALKSGKATDSQIESMLPEEVWKQIEDDAEISVKDVQKGYKKYAEEARDEYEDEYGKNFKITYKWTDKEEITDEQLTEIKDAITGKYEKIENKDIENAYKVDFTATIKGSEDDDEVEFEDFIVVQIGGKWYSNSAIMSAEDMAATYANYEKE